MDNQKFLTELVALQDCMETANDSITRLELLLKLANMKLELSERENWLKIASINLRLEKLENVTS